MATRDVTFRIDLPDAQASTVRALGDHTIDEALQALAEIAVREWLEWLIADDRPASLTEVSKRRVKALVESGLLPKLPTAPVIAQRARLSLGQARYIVSTLALEDPSGTLEARQGLVGREYRRRRAGYDFSGQWRLKRQQRPALVRSRMPGN